MAEKLEESSTQTSVDDSSKFSAIPLEWNRLKWLIITENNFVTLRRPAPDISPIYELRHIDFDGNDGKDKNSHGLTFFTASSK